MGEISHALLNMYAPVTYLFLTAQFSFDAFHVFIVFNELGDVRLTLEKLGREITLNLLSKHQVSKAHDPTKKQWVAILNIKIQIIFAVSCYRNYSINTGYT